MERTNEKSKRINLRIIYSRENRRGKNKPPTQEMEDIIVIKYY